MPQTLQRRFCHINACCRTGTWTGQDCCDLGPRESGRNRRKSFGYIYCRLRISVISPHRPGVSKPRSNPAHDAVAGRLDGLPMLIGQAARTMREALSPDRRFLVPPRRHR
jgi:hypothetical protein